MVRIFNAATKVVAAGVGACAFLARGAFAARDATLGLSDNNLQKNGIAFGKL